MLALAPETVSRCLPSLTFVVRQKADARIPGTPQVRYFNESTVHVLAGEGRSIPGVFERLPRPLDPR